MHARKVLLTLLLVSTVALTGTLVYAPQTSSQTRTQIIVAHPGPIYTMDSPVTWYISTHWLTRLMYDCLIWRKPDLSGYVPQIAERWENPEPERWRFHLRRNATFHNGEPINAEVVKWNLDRVRTRQDFMVHPQWQFMKEVRVVDAYTVDVITNGARPYTEYDISFNGCDLLPQRHIAQVGEREFARRPVGSGPYRLVEFREGERYVFEAWDGYWGGRPKIDRIIYQVIPDQATQVAALLAGQVDLVPSIPVSDRRRVQSAGFKIVETPSSTMHNIIARTGMYYGDMAKAYPGYKPVTLNKDVRHAVFYALDRNLLAKVQGSARPQLSRISCSFPEVPKKLCGEKAAAEVYDPAKAKRLLKRAGFDPDAGKKPLVYFDAPAFQVGNEKEVAEAVKSMLEAVGFDVRLNILDLSAFNSQIANTGRNRDLMLLPLRGSASLVPLFYRCEWPRNSYYHACDRSWQQVANRILTEMDTAKRLNHWQRWWAFFIDHASTITLYEVNALYAMNAKLDWSPRADGWITPRESSLRP